MRYLLILLGSICMTQVYGQTNKDLINYYNNELIKIDHQTFGGITLTLKGQTTSTAMGITNEFRDILSTYPDSKEEMRSYKQKNTVSIILIWGGTAAFLGGLNYSQPSRNEEFNLSDAKTRRGLSISFLGGFLAIIGIAVLPTSISDILKSVDLYNQNTIGNY